jgi:hypothetical protein
MSQQGEFMKSNTEGRQTREWLSLVAALFLIAFCAETAEAKALFSFQNPTWQAASSGKSNEGRQAKKPKKEKKTKGKQGGGVTFYEGSAESRSERDRRLTRECKGRPNAGACEGYARP